MWPTSQLAIHPAQLVQESHSELFSGEPHCAEICVFRCESKLFLHGFHANSHSTRCAKSHLLDRRASCPAVPTLTSIRTITFLQHTLRTLAHIRDHQNNARKSHIDTGIRLTATSFPAPSSIRSSAPLEILRTWFFRTAWRETKRLLNFFGGEPKSSV